METNKQLERTKRAQKLSRELKKLYPEPAGTALTYKTPWELLVAVVLSAQCTDKRVNEVTKSLFKKYRSLDDYLAVSQEEFEKDIHSTGFFRSKAKNILAAARKIKDEFGGEIPNTMPDLLTLPGVARKTANVVLGNAFGIVEGIAVDTHVRRFALKFDLSESRNPVLIERDLMNLLPKEEWFDFGNSLIYYGREICSARVHDCVDHPLTRIYSEAATRWPSAK